MIITKVNCPADKIAIKCPNKITPTRITVHNTYNDASAMSEISYMLGNNNECSFHYAVDDYRAVQGIDEDRNAWHAGDGLGKGNMQSISIEICYSKSGGDRFVKAERNGAELVALLLKKYGWGIDKVTKHQDYSGKYCPHRTLDMGWQRFLNMVQSFLNGSTPAPTPIAPSNKQVDVYYKVKTQKHGWLSEVRNLEDYAGWENSPIVGLAIKVNKGSIKYRVTTIYGKQLGWIYNYDINDYLKGYAGNGDPIATVEVLYETPNDIRPFKYAKYKVNNFDWQIDLYKKNGMDGYAGSKKQIATKFQITIDE